MTAQLRHGDLLDVLATFEPDSIDAVICDPPYGWSIMGKQWDDALPGVERWKAVIRVAKPGAYLLAAGGPRTAHRLICEIEDAGWEIRDSIAWVYAQGFPKSHNGPWGGTALKPSYEPIVVARKPLTGTVAQNFERYGTGGLDIDAARISTDWSGRSDAWKRSGHSARPDAEKITAPPGVGISCHPAGRWPANIIFEHDAGCESLPDWCCTEACPVRALDEQSGVLKSGGGDKGNRTVGTMGYGGNSRPWSQQTIGDTGTASRFFYCAKASRKDRGAGNDWPTVKPTKLMRYLVKLVSRPGQIVLDPFMGSGSTGVAAVLEGRAFIGIDREARAIEIARSRIDRIDPLSEVA